MFKWIKTLALTFALAISIATPALQAAGADTAVGDASNISGGLGTGDYTTGAGEATALTSTLMSVTHFALYIFYLLGVIFMGVAAVKFKNGDMEAMGKNFGGSVILFLVPKIVEVMIAWAAQDGGKKVGGG